MIPYTDINLGQKAERIVKITEEMVVSFAKLTGDENPVHLNEEYAKTSFFGQRIAHGMLISGFISGILGMDLPGPGAIYLSQSLEFKRPVYLNDTIRGEVLVTEKLDRHKKIKFLTSAYNQNGQLVLTGEAVVLAR